MIMEKIFPEVPKFVAELMSAHEAAEKYLINFSQMSLSAFLLKHTRGQFEFPFCDSTVNSASRFRIPP